MLLKYHPSSLNGICFSNFASTFDAVHGVVRRKELHHLDHIICLQSLLLTSIMNSCAYILETAAAVVFSDNSKTTRSVLSLSLSWMRRWEEYRLLCFAVLPSSTANKSSSSSNICFSLCDFSLFFSLLLARSMLFSVLCYLYGVRAKAMKDVIYYDFNFPSLPSSQPVSQQQYTVQHIVTISCLYKYEKVYFSYQFIHCAPGCLEGNSFFFFDQQFEFFLLIVYI